MKNFSIVFLLFLVLSCNSETESKQSEYKTVSIKSGPNNQVIDSVMFRIIKKNNFKRFEYKSTQNDTIFFHIFEKEIGNDSIIKTPDFDCKLIDFQFFIFNNEQVKVFKYSYDLPEVADEEEDYYFSDEFGIIFSRSIAWLKTSTLYNQEELKPLQDSIMSNLFKFKMSNPPPIIIQNKPVNHD